MTLSPSLQRNDDEVERHAAVDGRLALGLGHQRHFAALLEIAHRAEAAAFVGRSARDAEDAERVGRRFVGLLDLIAEQGHRAVGEPVEQRRAFRIRRSRARPRASCPAACASRAPRAGRRSSTRRRSAASSWRPRASARSSSRYIIDSRRSLSPHSGSTSLQLALVVALDADDRVKQPVDGQLARGDRIGDRIDEERHVVVDDADPHPPVAGFAADRLDRAARARRGCRFAATSARNSAASRSASRVKPWVSPGSAFPVSALRIDSTSGGSRRVWAVMERFCSAG